MADINKIKYKGTEYEITEEDSGWIEAILSDKFQVNTTLNLSYPPKYRRFGNIVDIVGVVSPTTELTTTSETNIFTLPEGYRPSSIRWFVCQGQNMKQWCMIVRPNGTVTLSRYGDATTKETMPTTAIAFLQATFIAN